MSHLGPRGGANAGPLRPWREPLAPAIRLALSLVRLTPRGLAYALPDLVMGLLARRSESELARAIRANQAVVRGVPSEDPDLGLVVPRVLRQAGRGYVDWLQALAGGPALVERSCRIAPSAEAQLRSALGLGRGVVFVGAHMNGFNLVMLLLVSLQASPLVLATAQVEGIHRVENALRERYGLRIESSGVVGLRRALLALREGRIVATGVDRPDPRGWSLQFFGQPACLPVGHIRLAMRVGAPVFAARVLPIGSGLYQLEGEVLDVRPVRVEEAALVVTVAEKVLQVMESSIRQRPDAWLMFERVWPDSVRSSPAAPAFGL